MIVANIKEADMVVMQSRAQFKFQYDEVAKVTNTTTLAHRDKTEGNKKSNPNVVSNTRPTRHFFGCARNGTMQKAASITGDNQSKHIPSAEAPTKISGFVVVIDHHSQTHAK